MPQVLEQRPVSGLLVFAVEIIVPKAVPQNDQRMCPSSLRIPDSVYS